MRILVCVKQVPDSWSERQLLADHRLDRDSAERVINDLDTYAVEAALQLAESHGGQTVALSMGPASAEEAVRKALQMGVDEGVLVTDSALAGSDALATARTLAAAISKLEPNLVIMGIESTDAKMSVIPAMVSEFLNWPMLTLAQALSVDSGAASVTVERQTPTGHDVVTSSLPAVVSVVEKFNEPRYPSFKGITAAKKKTVDVLDLGALGVDAASVGISGSPTQVVAASVAASKSAGVILDEDDAAISQVVDFLAERRLV
ncbi:MAG: electron transfer flavoprotein beta subunit/FixA family protein [Actinobacteria bacterium]|nr:electron transfer flavoprotein beta subunit/FixA family protein [Actinomycetota bacterium]